MTKPLEIIQNVTVETRTPIQGVGSQIYTVRISLPVFSGDEFARNTWIVKAMSEIRHSLRYSAPVDERFGVPDISSTLLAKEVCDPDNTKPEISALVLSDLLEEEGREDLANAFRVLAGLVNELKESPMVSIRKNDFSRSFIVQVSIAEEQFLYAKSSHRTEELLIDRIMDRVKAAIRTHE